MVDVCSYSIIGATPAATPTDFITIQGADGIVIELRKLSLSGVATTAGQMIASLIRRSAANTGGTKATQTQVLNDPRYTASSAIVSLYTANPTGLGASAGVLKQRRFLLALATAIPDRVDLSFDASYAPVIRLRGAADWLCLNFGGLAVPAGGKIDAEIEWTWGVA